MTDLRERLFEMILQNVYKWFFMKAVMSCARPVWVSTYQRGWTMKANC